MGANDDREMLEAARAECVRLEQIIAQFQANLSALARWLMEADIQESLEVLALIAERGTMPELSEPGGNQ
jgi:hypothetical protein